MNVFDTKNADFSYEILENVSNRANSFIISSSLIAYFLSNFQNSQNEWIISIVFLRVLYEKTKKQEEILKISSKNIRKYNTDKNFPLFLQENNEMQMISESKISGYENIRISIDTFLTIVFLRFFNVIVYQRFSRVL